MGSASSFLVIGKIEKQAMVDAGGAVVARDCLDLSFTHDERVSEGINHVNSALVLFNLLRHPQLLAAGETSIARILAVGRGDT